MPGFDPFGEEAPPQAEPKQPDTGRFRVRTPSAAGLEASVRSNREADDPRPVPEAADSASRRTMQWSASEPGDLRKASSDATPGPDDKGRARQNRTLTWTADQVKRSGISDVLAEAAKAVEDARAEPAKERQRQSTLQWSASPVAEERALSGIKAPSPKPDLRGGTRNWTADEEADSAASPVVKHASDTPGESARPVVRVHTAVGAPLAVQKAARLGDSVSADVPSGHDAEAAKPTIVHAKTVVGAPLPVPVPVVGRTTKLERSDAPLEDSLGSADFALPSGEPLAPDTTVAGAGSEAAEPTSEESSPSFQLPADHQHIRTGVSTYIDASKRGFARDGRPSAKDDDGPQWWKLVGVFLVVTGLIAVFLIVVLGKA